MELKVTDDGYTFNQNTRYMINTRDLKREYDLAEYILTMEIKVHKYTNSN